MLSRPVTALLSLVVCVIAVVLLVAVVRASRRHPVPLPEAEPFVVESDDWEEMVLLALLAANTRSPKRRRVSPDIGEGTLTGQSAGAP